jgi:hypothetical protein
MDVNSLNNIYNESGYRIRCMHSLAEQIKSDFAELNGLMKKLNTGSLDICEMEQILQKIPWIKQSLYILKKLRIIDIEGVIWGQIGKIEKDVEHIEIHFNDRIFPLATKRSCPR